MGVHEGGETNKEVEKVQFDIILFQYLDDWLNVHESAHQCEYLTQVLMRLCSLLGLLVNKTKSEVVPTQSIVFLRERLDPPQPILSHSRAEAGHPIEHAGHLNVLADLASRTGQVIPSEWAVATPTFRWICESFPEVDLFANSRNHCLRCYVSPCPDLEAWATDALICPWPAKGNLCLPPYVLDTSVPTSSQTVGRFPVFVSSSVVPAGQVDTNANVFSGDIITFQFRYSKGC